MPTVLLLRHGLTALTGPVLVGRTPGVGLDDRGRAQAATAAARIAALPVTTIVTSPLDRCLQTAEAVLGAQREAGRDPAWVVDERVVECDYGDWTGQAIKDLVKTPTWKLVQTQPSAVRFPGGETAVAMSGRAVDAVRTLVAGLQDNDIAVVCSHGDLIKAILADALGLHLDQFQRIVADPCSVSVVRYTDTRPYVLRTNDVSGDLSAFAPPKRRRRAAADPGATIGGGAGAGTV